MFVNLALWNPGDYDVEEYGRYAAYFLEAMCRMGERFIVIFDMKGWKLSHAMHMRKEAAGKKGKESEQGGQAGGGDLVLTLRQHCFRVQR